MTYDQEYVIIGSQTWSTWIDDGKKVILKRDRQKGLINAMKESKMFEDRYETSLATTMLMKR